MCYLTAIEFNENSDFEPDYGEPIHLHFTYKNRSVSTGPFEFFTIHCNSASPPNRIIFRENFFNVRYKSFPKNNKYQSFINSPSVVMIALESMTESTMNILLPSTMNALHELEFITFKGHTAVSDYSFANMMAALTGKRAFDVMDFKAELPRRDEAFFDSWNHIWKDFAREHYTTLFAEDQPDKGLFNYHGQSCGFKQEPVDYYMRPFWIATIWSLNGRLSTNHCYKSSPRHAIQLQYLRDVLSYRSRNRVFAYSHFRELSLSNTSKISLMDDDLAAFIRDTAKRRNTVIILFSDRGGVAERSNAEKRVTTHYDLHATLIDMSKGLKSVAKQSNTSHGTSLFLDISADRSCGDAGIPSDKCACYIEMDLPAEEAVEPAEVVVAHMNSMIRAYETEKYASDNEIIYDEDAMDRFDCAPVELGEAISATARILSASRKHPVRLLQISFRAALPLNTVYETVLVRDDEESRWIPTEDIQVVGRPPNINNASLCVVEPLLKKFCYCLKR